MGAVFQTDRVAVLLATYNGETYIREQLDSLLAQSFEEWVCCIHDDASRDATPEIIREYAEKYPDKFVVIPGAACGGACKNFLYLIKSVEAPLYMCCDQDDVWLRDKMKITLERMRTLDAARPVLVFTDLKVVDSRLNVMHESMAAFQRMDFSDLSLRRLAVSNVVSGCTMMFNRKLRDTMLRCGNPDRIIMHDWWAAIVAAQFGTIEAVHEPTMLYRQHGTNVVGAVAANSLATYVRKLSHLKNIVRSIDRTRIQAREMAESFGLAADEFAYRYGAIGEKNKLQRIGFYFRNRLRKSTLIGTIAYYFLG